MKRALVFGGTGMLGQAVTEHWRRQGRAVLALSRVQGDITDPDRIEFWVRRFHPEVVINCAAFTQVDNCESEVDRAMAANGSAVGHVVAAAQKVNAELVHISSDYVFDGQGGQDGEGRQDGPVPYTEEAPTGPMSVYGRSKLAGEREALAYPRSLVIRASWLFGPGGPNFVATMQKLARQHPSLRVVDDQVGCPTYTPFLARAIWDLTVAGVHGVIHYCNRDAVSWYGFAREILGDAVDITPTTTAEFPRPAPRPSFSVLETQRFEEAVGRRVEPWIHGLGAYLEISGERS